MKMFISLLRGINVSGKNRISMPDLKRLYESLGLGNVRTYIQSGNVVFDSMEDNPAIIVKKLETGIEKTLGIDVRVVVRDQKELIKIMNSNPFIIDRITESEKLYVTFLSDLPKKFAVKNITAAADGGGSPQGLDSDSRVVISKDSGGSPQPLDSNSRMVLSEDGRGRVKVIRSSKFSTNNGNDEGSKKRLDPNWHGTNDQDEFIICDRQIYLFCPNGYGKTKFSNTFFERKLGVTATTRNWKTVKALFEMARQR